MLLFDNVIVCYHRPANFSVTMPILTLIYLQMMNLYNYFYCRYVQNNFLDGARQDSYDILVGNHRYSTVEESPLAKPRHPVAIFLPAVIGIFIALLILKVRT